MKNFRELLDSDGIFVFDGAVGTRFYDKGVYINRSYDELNLVSPDLVREVHAEYVKAGADIIETNTFGATRHRLQAYGLEGRLKEINVAGVKLAREAADAMAAVMGHESALALQRHGAQRMTEAKLAQIGQMAGAASGMDAGQMLMAEHIVEAAKAGDEVANKVWHDACYYLAVATVTMQHVTNPERVVMAGGLIAAGDFLLEPIRRHFRELTWELLDDFPDIRFATLGNDAGFIGAAGCARMAFGVKDA